MVERSEEASGREEATRTDPDDVEEDTGTGSVASEARATVLRRHTVVERVVVPVADSVGGEEEGRKEEPEVDANMTSRFAAKGGVYNNVAVNGSSRIEEEKRESIATTKYRGFLEQARFLPYVVAVLGSLLVYGLLQERVMTQPYKRESSDGIVDPNAEPVMDYFSNSLFLVFQNRLFALVIAVLLAVLVDRDSLRANPSDEYNLVGSSAPVDRDSPRPYSARLPRVRAFKYFLVSASNIVATNCQYEALKYVSFPTQTLFKCGKMIPVMLLSTYLSRKSYRMLDYCVALIVGLGCFSFAMTGNIASKKSVALHAATASSTWFGIILMLVYLLADSLTSTMQEHLFQDEGETLNRQMMHVNLSSSILTVVLMLLRGSFFSSINFFATHPSAIWETSFLSLAAVASQYAITGCVFAFGSLTYVTIMTVRQIVSVLLSNLVFGHQLGMTQWVCIVSVFGALLLRSCFGKGSTVKKVADPPDHARGPDARV
ncbi:Adenosine 3'-phospho 5'-phosphosulfate transporter 1 [Porphyridium purpureum]|uniref:Adenosine 3'-phospho 5'-phosphosulfate transporter 1 n=1 Tax=Porphyridium purpureum TaxID=35688 RepID=A0A5J4YKH9_PORPP|nr:Adenosine 3'-phospho 5'-phosphosulfate transporter 1 [Porphyridium purpureum]|eukprot:POR4100..scf244_11